MKRVLSIIAAIFWSCAAHAQSLNIPGVQAAGTPTAPHIASWLNANTLTDTGVSITGLTVGVTAVGLTSGNQDIFTTGNIFITSNGNLTFSFLPQTGVLASPAGGGKGNVSFRPLTGSDFGSVQTHAVLIGPLTGAAAAPTFRQLTGSDLPAPTISTLGGVQAVLTVASNWVDAILTTGVPHLSRPSYSDISGTLTASTLNGVLSCGGIPILTGAVSSAGGTCTTSIPSNSLSNGELAVMSGGSIKGYVGTGTGQPIDLSPSAALDVLNGNALATGNTLARASTGWVQVAPATSGYIWQANGAGALPGWVSGGFFSILGSQTFTSSGTYTPSSTMKYNLVFCTGGGNAAGSNGTTAGGGGGGAGATVIGIFSASQIGASKTVTVGAAGSPSAFSSLTCGAGNVGGNGSGGAAGGGGSGGTGSGGILQIPGGYGGTGFGDASGTPYQGIGGASFWGGQVGAYGTGGTFNHTTGVQGVVLILEFD